MGRAAGPVYVSGTGHAGFMESRSQIHDADLGAVVCSPAAI